MKNYLSEFIGTFALVFCGTGAIIINDLKGGIITHPGVAVVFGLVVLGMIYAVGEISGAHFNPAVTLGFWIAGRLPGRQVAPYIVSQVLAALAGSLALRIIFPDVRGLGATLPVVSPGAAFLLEVLISFFLMFVIINVSTGSKEQGALAGVAIGAVVTLCALFAGPITGASMNPARSLGPALISGQTTSLWIYMTAPILGAGLAVLGCRGVKDKSCCDKPGALCGPMAEPRAPRT